MSFFAAIYAYFVSPLLTLLIWVVIINAILSWLVGFNVVNPRNQIVSMIGRFTDAVTQPLLRPLRRFIPSIGGIDITPLILILILFFLRDYLFRELLLSLLS